mmetsp:Transcript_4367/g.10678  ORF Transcript_4367/g.10678 Transcript_4367/m.10678 type:complete len:702 (-) Transcript_4367:941-3046(-)|eukprot:CAMPEP_0174891502 /NCGR_PEP_ID=MMETSP0167-20121228/6565_1 /TAXON_ID=38298 /ORGANISM="Rhodella maculata, Strain CCMP736" /LENGTH=701 /DNA_ID=CAMNT_0016129705 /DNA_START=82 /DNA_END=2187 /DNA_ORIENTATION=+
MFDDSVPSLVRKTESVLSFAEIFNLRSNRSTSFGAVESVGEQNARDGPSTLALSSTSSDIDATSNFGFAEIAVLNELSKQYPTLDNVAAEIALREGCQARAPGPVHVISDIHGEAGKLKHVLGNASGTLRPLVEKILGDSLKEHQIRRTLFLIFNPCGFYEHYEQKLRGEAFFLENQILRCVTVLRHIVALYPMAHVESRIASDFRTLVMELIYSPAVESSPPTTDDPACYVFAVASALRRTGRIYRFLRVLSRCVRDLSTSELIVGGDLWDRGARGDIVCDVLMKEPSTWITWGNHDIAWYGACLGSEALIAYVLRVSCRYNVLAQIEEGYGISLAPLERLATTVYGDDPASRYLPKNTKGHRDECLLSQMHKAAAVLQYKLEGQIIRRHPEFKLDQDMILHTFNIKDATCQLDGKTYTLLDTNFPTIDPADAYALSPEEEECVKSFKKSFYQSQKLWEHMKFMINRGSSYIIRHDHLIFHGAVPVDEKGDFISLEINGKNYAGKELFEACNREVIASLRSPTPYRLDLMWYLWMGPASPFMAKERVATIERDLIPDHDAWLEKKNPYFKLLHEAWFCDRILAEFGCSPDGLIINGHVPVHVKSDEDPVKKSGKAVAIDGAFSQAYGDYGYTLVIDPRSGKSLLAEHHHTEDAFDVVPKTRCIKEFHNLTSMHEVTVANEIAMLEKLVLAYESNKVPQRM